MDDLPPTRVITFIGNLMVRCAVHPATWVLLIASLIALAALGKKSRLWEVWLLYGIGFVVWAMVPSYHEVNIPFPGLWLGLWATLLMMILITPIVQELLLEEEEVVEWRK